MAHLYHGTTSHRLAKIRRDGWRTPLIYLADSEEGTEMYMTNALEIDEMEGVDDNAGVVLAFDLGVLEATGTLGPDWDDMQTAWSLGEIDRPPDEVSWEESLGFGGTVSYRGPLREALVGVREYG